MTSRVGQRLGNYRLLRLIGSGGFSEVYLGEHIHIGTQNAIKVLSTHLAYSDVEQFRQEARMIARLEHPNIVRILEFGIEGSVPFFVMNYALYGTLRERHPKGQHLELSLILQYVQQIANALQYAHNEKMIHRDIKPENMLLGRQGEVLLSDFGIALVDQSSRYQGTQDLAGTAAYMAPEQIEGHPRPASDQYSLGIVVYEWLCGDRPFHGTFTEIALKHSLVPPPSLCVRLPDLLPEVEQVVFTALAKDPKKRFGSVHAFARALQQASSIPILQPPTIQDSPLYITESAIPTDISNQQKSQVYSPVSSSGEQQSIPIGTNLAQQFVFPQQQAGRISPPSVTPSSISRWNVRLKRISRWQMVLLAVLAVFVIGFSMVGLALLHRGVQNTVPQNGDVQTYDSAVIANGIMFGFDSQQTRNNPYEHTISRANVPALAEIWSAKTDTNFYSSPTVAYGQVYISSYSGYIYAFDAVKGSLIWKTLNEVRGYIDHSSPAVFNGLVYISNNIGELYAFNARTRQQQWVETLEGGGDPASPVVANNLVYVAAKGFLYAYDASDPIHTNNKRNWATYFGHTVNSSPIIANGSVYLGTADGRFYAFNSLTGKFKWVINHDDLGNPLGDISQSSPTFANGLAYVGSTHGFLYAIKDSGSSGTVTRSFDLNYAIQSSPAIADGIVYVSLTNGFVYAFDVTTGKQKWAKSNINAGNSSPTIANGLIYIGSTQGILYVFDANSGASVLASNTLVSTPTPTSTSNNANTLDSPVVANGYVYVGSTNDYLYAFHLPL